MKRILRNSIAFMMIGLFVLGCSMFGKDKPPKPAKSSITIAAVANVNPDTSGKASPVVTRFYELADRAVFDKADFFALYEKDTQLLAGDLIHRDEIELQPGKSKKIDRVLDPKTKFIAIVAAYRDLEHARWRFAFAVNPKKERRYTVTIDTLTASIQQEK